MEDEAIRRHYASLKERWSQLNGEVILAKAKANLISEEIELLRRRCPHNSGEYWLNDYYGIFGEEPDQSWGKNRSDEFFYNKRVIKAYRDEFGTQWSNDFHDAVVNRCKTVKGKKLAHERIFKRLVNALVDAKVIKLKTTNSISQTTNNFRQARLTKGLTLVGLASKVKSSAGYIHDIENGRRKPSPEMEKKLVKALK